MKKIVIGCIHENTTMKTFEQDIIVTDRPNTLRCKGDELTHIWNTAGRICRSVARCKGFNTSHILCMGECEEEDICSEMFSLRLELDFYFDYCCRSSCSM